MGCKQENQGANRATPSRRDMVEELIGIDLFKNSTTAMISAVLPTGNNVSGTQSIRKAGATAYTWFAHTRLGKCYIQIVQCIAV